MRQRKGYGGAGQTADRISMKGVLPQWRMCGVVQMVHSNGSSKYPADFVRFQIRPQGRENDDSAFGVVFAVTVPDSLGWQLERGDKVALAGTITSWKNDNGFRIELVATEVKEWDGLFKSERQQQQQPERKRIGSGQQQQETPPEIERRGYLLYPAGTAPQEKKPEDAEQVDFAEFEAEVIGGEAPPF